MTELLVSSRPGRALTCGYCGKYLSREQVDEFHTYLAARCRNCDRVLFEKHINPHILKSSQKYLDSEEVLSANWWHSTRKKNWHKVVPDDATVHLGTYHSARHRGQHTEVNKTHPLYLYKVRLKDGVQVNKSIYRDKSDNSRKAGKGKTTRYVNIFESPGSISIIARMGDLEVVSFEQFNR